MSEDIEFDETAIEELLTDPMGPVGRDLERRALNVEVAAKRLLSTPGTGRVYRRRSVLHQASAPGQPPAVDTGYLRASVDHKVGTDAEGLYADIGTEVDYGLYLEQGTRYMQPRPWLKPALDAAAVDEP